MGSSEISSRLFEITLKKKVPLICTFELTRRCNLECRHCYLERGSRAKPGELSTNEVKGILGQLAGEGTLNLVFTGGEIFLRNDLSELCAFARELRFDLRLFTNSTLINEKSAKALSLLSLSGVEISLYGRERTHDYITRVRGSFRKTLNAIKMLKGYNVPVTIKSPLMTVNFSDYPWLESFSEKLKVKLRLDPAISPRNDGDKTVLRYRLTDRQLKEIYSDPYFFPEDDSSGGGQMPDLLCSAGHNLFFIGFDGTVYPCLQLPVPLGNLRQKSFSNIWNVNNRALSGFRNIGQSDLVKCRKCGLAPVCQRCPGIALVEDGDLFGPSKISCKIAKIRNCE